MRTIAPHLARPLPFLIPLDDAVGRGTALKTMVGLRVGDGLRVAARTSRRAAAAAAAGERARGAPARSRPAPGRACAARC